MLAMLAGEPDARVAGNDLLLVARQGSEVVAALHGRVDPGGSGVLSLPAAASASARSALPLLLPPVHEWFRLRHAPLVRALGDVWRSALERFGYRAVTEILALETDLGRPGGVASTPAGGLQFDRVSPAVNRRLIGLLARTYAGSAEFAGLPESRDPVVNLQDHAMSSGPRALWYVLRHEYRDIGLLLIGRASGEAELLYLGIVPEWRRRGFGLMAISYAFQELQRHAVCVVRTSVDIANEPAIHCYVAAGFHQTARRTMLVYRF